MANIDLKELARVGARVRIQELHAEIEAIRRAFPGEFGFRGGAKRRTPAAKPVRRRKRSTMTAAQRKEVSVRMKKYWAARRKAK